MLATVTDQVALTVCRRPVTGSFPIDVKTFRPLQSISRGRLTLSERRRSITLPQGRQTLSGDENRNAETRCPDVDARPRPAKLVTNIRAASRCRRAADRTGPSGRGSAVGPRCRAAFFDPNRSVTESTAVQSGVEAFRERGRSRIRHAHLALQGRSRPECARARERLLLAAFGASARPQRKDPRAAAAERLEIDSIRADRGRIELRRRRRFAGLARTPSNALPLNPALMRAPVRPGGDARGCTRTSRARPLPQPSPMPEGRRPRTSER